MEDITIVGFGPVGISIYINLLEKLLGDKQIAADAYPTITIVEKSHRSGGEGMVFGTRADCHILNSPSYVMSLVLNKPNDFIDWLAEHPEKWREHYPQVDHTSTTYLPRGLFGRYIEDRKRTALERAQMSGIATKVVEDEVVDINQTNLSDLRLVLRNGPPITTKYAVLCLGLLPSSHFTRFIGTHNYFHSPWPAENLIEKVPDSEDVVILGSRTSAIDVALTFRNRNHKGRLIMASRSGALPRIIGPHHPKELLFISDAELAESSKPLGKKLSLSEFFNLIGQEIEYREGRAIDWQIEMGRWSKTSQAFHEELKLVNAGVHRPWQSVLKDLYLCIPNLWQSLDDDGKRTFLTRYASTWRVFMDAIPPANAARISELLQTGQLEVRGGFRALTYDQQSKLFCITTYDEETQRETKTTVRYVVNATGPGSDVTASGGSDLLTNLVQNQVVHPDPLGGIKVCPETFGVRDANNTVTTQLFVAGDLTRGTWLYTATLGRGRRQGKRIIDTIVSRLKLPDGVNRAGFPGDTEV